MTGEAKATAVEVVVSLVVVVVVVVAVVVVAVVVVAVVVVAVVVVVLSLGLVNGRTRIVYSGLIAGECG